MRFGLAWVLLALAWTGCLGPDREPAAGGSGSEGENGGAVSGIVRYANGRPAAGIPVTIRPSAYLRDSSADVPELAPDLFTDSTGAFRVQLPSRESYTLEFRDGNGKAALRRVVGRGPGTDSLLSPDTLLPTGTLSGILGTPPGLRGPIHVQVYGLERSTRADSSGRFVLSGLPAGANRIQAVSPWPEWAYPPSAMTVVAPKDTARVSLQPVGFEAEEYSQWTSHRPFRLNPAAAGVNGAVADFPLLVRLDSSRFDFSASDGRDIRFSDAQGRRLAYERADWDARRKTGSVWVRVDTLRGNGPPQTITLHWGKPDAPDFSDGRRVFTGFAAVWHLSGSSDRAGSGRAGDATARGHDGRLHRAGSREGVAGPGLAFDARDSAYVDAEGTPLLMPARQVTLSLWTRVTEWGVWGSFLASMGDSYSLWMDADGSANFTHYTDSTYDPDHDPLVNPWNVCAAPGPDLRNSGWHWLAAAYDGETMRIFVDGRERAARFIGKPMTYPFHHRFLMGKATNDPANWRFSGGLDEVHVSVTARSPDWIRLAFENQRPGSNLLEF